MTETPPKHPCTLVRSTTARCCTHSHGEVWWPSSRCCSAPVPRSEEDVEPDEEEGEGEGEGEEEEERRQRRKLHLG